MVDSATQLSGREQRLLVELAKGAMMPGPMTDGRLLLLDGARRLTVSLRDLQAVVRQGLVERRSGAICLSRTGRSTARRLLSENEPFRDQHMELEQRIVETEDGRQAVTVNLAESPLAQLMRLKTQGGARFLTEAEFEAGERLRADFTRGQILPRLGANWEASISTGRRAGPGTELTDGAIAARRKVEDAIRAVGPELSGVLVDVCCFLKGLGQVELERSWPARSAKLLLKSALGSLARHYNPGWAHNTGRILIWGSDDYRPRAGA